MSSLRAWSAKPGIYRSEMQEFIAGATPVDQSRVLASPQASGVLAPLVLIAGVPPESTKLVELAAEHQADGMTSVDHSSRWAILLPGRREPHPLARLDLRLGGRSIFEARLLFDIAEHGKCLWAAAHTGWVALVSHDRFLPQHDPVHAIDCAPAMMFETLPSPLAEALARLEIEDPFASAKEPPAKRRRQNAHAAFKLFAARGTRK
jgi:hypothetical protein